MLVNQNLFAQLKLIGNNIWESPGGLVYGPDKKFGNRLQHVLAHTTPNLQKKTHTVFSIPPNKIIELIDEAWAIKGAPLPLDPCAYIVDMKKIVGTSGEKSLLIAVKTPGCKEIVSAYPIK